MDYKKLVSKMYSTQSLKLFQKEDSASELVVKAAIAALVERAESDIIRTVIDFASAVRAIEFFFYVPPLTLKKKKQVQNFYKHSSANALIAYHRLVPPIDASKYAKRICYYNIDRNADLARDMNVARYFFSDSYASIFNFGLDRRIRGSHVTGSLVSSIRPKGYLSIEAENINDKNDLRILFTHETSSYTEPYYYSGLYDALSHGILAVAEIIGPHHSAVCLQTGTDTAIFSIDDCSNVLGNMSIFYGTIPPAPQVKLFHYTIDEADSVSDIFYGVFGNEFDEFTKRLMELYREYKDFLYRKFILPAFKLRDKYIIPAIHKLHNAIGSDCLWFGPSPMLLYALLLSAYYLHVFKYRDSKKKKRIEIVNHRNKQIVMSFEGFMTLLNECFPFEEIASILRDGFVVDEEVVWPSMEELSKFDMNKYRGSDSDYSRHGYAYDILTKYIFDIQ